jgi:hypothetical protein
LPLHHQEAVQLVPAVRIAAAQAGQAREVVEHHQFGIAPSRHQPVLAFVVGQVEQRSAVQIGQQELEAGRRRAEAHQPLLHLDRRHLAVEIGHAVRPLSPPAEEALTRRRGAGDAQRHEGLAQAARAVQQGKALGREDRIEDRRARRQRRHGQFGPGQEGQVVHDGYIVN